jgi:hypothetical protein
VASFIGTRIVIRRLTEKVERLTEHEGQSNGPAPTPAPCT